LKVPKCGQVSGDMVYLIMGKVPCANHACYRIFQESYSALFNGTYI